MGEAALLMTLFSLGSLTAMMLTRGSQGIAPMWVLPAAGAVLRGHLHHAAIFTKERCPSPIRRAMVDPVTHVTIYHLSRQRISPRCPKGIGRNGIRRGWWYRGARVPGGRPGGSGGSRRARTSVNRL